ncbi:MAG: hypothetical protein ACPG8W_06820 [Candidatus Promineifilaceae bacterium]
MNFRDHFAEDANGKQFIFTVEMQRRLHDAGLPVEPASIDKIKEQFAAKQQPRRREAAPERVEERLETLDTDEATGKFIGKLLSFDSRKGSGFVAHGMGRLYFHQKQALDDPRYMSIGQKVLYNINIYRGKEEAIDVEEYDEILD